MRSLAALALVVALAAPASAQSFSWPKETQDELDRELAATWTRLRPTLEASLRHAVKKQVGTTHGKLTIDKLDVASLDVAAPPRLALASIGANAHRLTLELPGAKRRWAVTLKGHLTYDLDTKVLFIHVRKRLSEDVTIAVSDLHATDEVELDTTDPTRPVCRKTGTSQLDYDLKVKTGSFFLNVVLFFAKPWVNGLLSDEVDKVRKEIDARLAALKGLPGPAWGEGAPAPPALGQSPDLEKAALATDDDIQRWHVPFGTILGATFSDPTYGQGNVTGHVGHGDSAIWTGHYLAGESFRWAVTKDPAAQKNTAKLLDAIEDLLDAEKPGAGYLARCFVPLSDPSAAKLQADPAAFTTTVRGQACVALEHISRDQYLGVVHGLGCAHDLLDDPAQKQKAGDLLARIVDTLVAHDWVAPRHDRVTPSAPFLQSPDKMVAFTALAAHVDPRFQAVRDRVAPLVHVTWLESWTGLLDPLHGYYAWNLGNGARYHAMRLETDPARFMALERAHAIERRGIGHHGNAYFQTVDAAVDPSLAGALGPEVEDGLRHFVTRSRRQLTTLYSQDPNVVKDDYTAPLSWQKSSGSLVAVKEPMAKYPLPVEKRGATDFLWQRNPFQLDTYGDPHEQQPGVDLVLPYWMARHLKLVP